MESQAAGNQVAEGPCWESGMRSAPGRPDPLAGELERAGPGDSGHSSAGLTFGHVAREPTRHVATVQREVLPPGGPGGATQRARSQPHGAWSPSSVHRGGPLPRRTRPPSQRPGSRVPGSSSPGRGPRVRTTLLQGAAGAQGAGPGLDPDRSASRSGAPVGLELLGLLQGFKEIRRYININ